MIHKLIDSLRKFESYEMACMQDYVSISKRLSLIEKKEIALLPYNINVIYSAANGKLKEIAHSKILIDFLQHEKIRESFLSYFFRDRIVYTDDIRLEKAETKNIDVSIRGKDFFIIIENKVNNAEERNGQIFRYVEVVHKEYGYDYSQIYVLYLNSDNYDHPSEKSTTKEGKGTCKIISKRKLPSNNFLVKSYKYDILAWLHKVRNDFIDSKKEVYIDSALCQYIDYLENKFQISTRYNDMNNKIQKLLIEELEITNDSIAGNIDTINDAIANAEKLQEHLVDLKREYLKKLFIDCKDKIGDKCKLENEFEISVYFKYEKHIVSVNLWCDDDLDLYWGLHNENGKFSKKMISHFESLAAINGLLIGERDEMEFWPIINYVSAEDAFRSYETLIKILEEAGGVAI